MLPNKPAVAAKHAKGQELQSSIPVFDQLAETVGSMDELRHFEMAKSSRSGEWGRMSQSRKSRTAGIVLDVGQMRAEGCWV